MIGTVEGVHGALETFEGMEKPRNPTQHRHWRIVGMKRQRDPGLLGYGQHTFHEVAIVVPHRVGVEGTAFEQWMFFDAVAQRKLVDQIHIEGGNHRTAASWNVGGAPHAVGHPVIPQHRNPSLAHVTNRGLVIGDLLVAPRETQHRTGVERDRHIFERLDPQTVLIAALLDPTQIVDFPTLRPGNTGVLSSTPLASSCLAKVSRSWVSSLNWPIATRIVFVIESPFGHQCPRYVYFVLLMARRPMAFSK